MSNITLMGVIISYPTLFTAKAFTNSQGVPQGDPKYSADFLISPNHPQRAIVEKMASDAETAGFPGGMPSGCNNAVRSYDELYNGSDSYNPSLSGWLVVKCTAKQDNKPAVVDINKQEVIDPSSAYGGAKVNAAIGISAYTGGVGGIGGWLNGVQLTGEDGELGRFDNKPSVDQMFGCETQAPSTPAKSPASPPPAPNAAPTPPPVPQQRVMLPAANGATYEQMVAAGWNDEQLIANNMMQAPVATPSFDT